MNVGTVMSRGVVTCTPDDSLNRAAQIMWENDCGCVPVVDAGGVMIGMVTDRDVCMAAYTQGRALAQISVASASSKQAFTVGESADIGEAERAMAEHRVRRIAVVDGSGRPLGIVSMNDLARHVHEKKHGHRPDSLAPEPILRTLTAICQPTGVAPIAAAE